MFNGLLGIEFFFLQSMSFASSWDLGLTGYKFFDGSFLFLWFVLESWVLFRFGSEVR